LKKEEFAAVEDSRIRRRRKGLEKERERERGLNFNGERIGA
jgi:hypothetical protein